MRSLLALLSLAAAANAGTISFLAGDFSTNWTTVKNFDDGGGGGTTVGSRIASGGDPNAYREVKLTYSTAGQQLSGVSLWSTATFDPSQGALLNVTYNWSQYETGQGGSAYLQIRPLLQQGGSNYAFVTNNTPTTGWASYTSGALAQANFCDISVTCGSGAIHPNFSTSGGVITFGYQVLGADYGATLPFNQSGNIDNFGITGTSAAPEPASAALAGSALAGLWWFRRRRTA